MPLRVASLAIWITFCSDCRLHCRAADGSPLHGESSDGITGNWEEKVPESRYGLLSLWPGFMLLPSLPSWRIPDKKIAAMVTPSYGKNVTAPEKSITLSTFSSPVTIGTPSRTSSGRQAFVSSSDQSLLGKRHKVKRLDWTARPLLGGLSWSYSHKCLHCLIMHYEASLGHIIPYKVFQCLVLGKKLTVDLITSGFIMSQLRLCIALCIVYVVLAQEW